MIDVCVRLLSTTVGGYDSTAGGITARTEVKTIGRSLSVTAER